MDSTGASVVSYTYDAWGKPLTTTGTLATTLGQDNPFRYRGYYYDAETGLYYLKSRYYDPDTGKLRLKESGAVIRTKRTGVIAGRLSPGMIPTDFITKTPDGSIATYETNERFRKIFNILADKPETIAAFFVPRMMRNTTNDKQSRGSRAAKPLGDFSPRH